MVMKESSQVNQESEGLVDPEMISVDKALGIKGRGKRPACLPCHRSACSVPPDNLSLTQRVLKAGGAPSSIAC